MISKSFYESLEAISEERSLDIDKILAKVEIAMSVACKNSDVPYKGTIKIEADPEAKKSNFIIIITLLKKLIQKDLVDNLLLKKQD